MKAPRESITIKVDSNTAHEVEEETGKYIVVVEVKNDEAVGKPDRSRKQEKCLLVLKSNRADTDKIKEWSGKGSKPSV